MAPPLRNQGIDLSKPWHTIPPGDVFDALRSDRSGLTADEIDHRIERFGFNRINQGKSVSALRLAINQFTSPLIYVLLGAGLATLFLERWSDSIVIGAVLVVNGLVGFIQEYRAENAIQALMQMVAPEARVRRGGEVRYIDQDKIVPGDVLLLREGDIVPADGRLFSSAALHANEAALTGESVPQSLTEHAMEDAEEDLPPAEINNVVYMGTAVTSGEGEAVVIGTGAGTEVGRIAQSIRRAETQQTPLQRRMDRLARFIAVMILSVAVVSVLVGLAAGRSLEQMFLLAVSLAVAAMPAGLPVVMTVALAVGVRRMARRHAVIRHLPAVETLGSTTVIVTDKTGTLTRNEMTVREVATARESFDLDSGKGQHPQTIEQVDRFDVWSASSLQTTLLLGVLNNGAMLYPSEGDGQGDGGEGEGAEHQSQHQGVKDVEPGGDPMDVASLLAGREAGMDRESLLRRYQRIDEVPFESEKRYSASVHRDRETGETLVCLKGGPEIVLDMCDRALDQKGETVDLDRSAVESRIDGMASRGLRVLGFAVGRGEDAHERLTSGSPSGFLFTGLQGFMDPPRDEAIRAVDDSHRAGIRVVMVTGDHARTASAIGKQVHLDRSVETGGVTQADRPADGERESGRVAPAEHSGGMPEAVQGREMQGMSTQAFDDTLRRVNVFARFEPDGKLRMVRRLREMQNVVAVTGDGVNDAPALKEADLGCAMGRTGTDVAKEASDMVITDDNLASVYSAVEEGRTAFRNIRMATFFLLSTGAADVLIILTALGAGWPLPLIPTQILWCNVVTNGIADVALGFEPGDRRLYRRPPRPPGEGVLNSLLIERLVVIGIWLAVGTLGVFVWMLHTRGASVETARVAALTTLVLFQKVHVFNCRSEDTSIFRKSLLENKMLFIGVLTSLAVHIGAMYVPATQRLLEFRPLDWLTWLVMIVVGITAIIPNELHKLLRARPS